MLKPLAAFLLLLAAAGCSQGTFITANAPAPTSTQPAVAYSYYHAYGDSITAGYLLPNLTYDYVSLAATYNSLTLTDNAISGDQACDVATRQIFPNQDSPTLATSSLYTLLIGTNDIDNRGTGAYEQVFNLCQQASLAWLATPLEDKVLATSAAVQTTGASVLETAGNWNSIVTQALGSTVMFPFQRTVTAPLYVWYRLGDYNPGTFACTLDGNAIGSFTTAAPQTIATANGTSNSLGLIRVPTVPPGSHTFTCTQTSSGPNGMGLVAIGGPPPAGTRNLPRVLVGLVPLQLNGLHASVLTAYDADVQANQALLAADGLDIELFDAAKYMTGTTTDLADVLHPNPLGHQEIFKALQEVLK